MSRFTLVRHGGYSVARNSAFDDAVEVCELGVQQVYAVRAAGGLIFETRPETVDAQNDINHPAGAAPGGASGRGHFSSLRLGCAEIYVPDLAKRVY